MSPSSAGRPRGLLIANPNATTTSPRMRDVLTAALAHEIDLEVVTTTHRGHAVDLGAWARSENLDLVVTLGGDGTINETVNGLLHDGPTPGLPILATIPGGSANVLARALGFPNDQIEATGLILESLHSGTFHRIGLGLARFAPVAPADQQPEAGPPSPKEVSGANPLQTGQGNQKPTEQTPTEQTPAQRKPAPRKPAKDVQTDHGQDSHDQDNPDPLAAAKLSTAVKEHWFTINAGVGLDAEVIRAMEEQRAQGHTATGIRYVTTAVNQYFRSSDRHAGNLTIRRAGVPPIESVTMAIICNTAPWTYLGSMPINPCPHASFDTGLDVFAPHSLSLANTVRVGSRMLRASRGGSIRNGLTVLHDQPSFEILADRPTSLQMDGEGMGKVMQVSFTSVPKALRIAG